MKRVLVTGNGGFIGSYFVKWLLERESDVLVVGFTRNSDSHSINWRLKDIVDHSRFNQVYGDLTDKNAISGLCEDIDYVINFAAKTFVDHALKDPHPFIQSNIIGADNLMEDAARYNVKKFIQVSCYDLLTRAVTSDGYKRFDELEVGDSILSLNPDTSVPEWKPIEEIIVQDYSGPMVGFYSKSVSLRVTPNHRMLVKEKNSTLTWRSAEDQAKRSVGYLPSGEIDPQESPSHEDLMFLMGIYIGDGHVSKTSKKVASKRGLTKEEYLLRAKDSLGKFTIVSEIGNNLLVESVGYRTYLEVPVGDKARSRLISTLDRLKVKYSAFEKNIYIGGKKWYDIFAEFGTGAYNKSIPSRFLSLGKEDLTALFEGLMLSDGSKRPGNSYQYTTVSEKLAAQVTLIAYQLGWKVSSSIHKSISYIENRLITGQAYYLILTRTESQGIHKHISSISEYNGKVWCLKVKDNKNFLIERLGRHAFCGNTDEVYGQILEGKYTEESRLNPRNPYSWTKAATDLNAIWRFNTYNFPVIITRTENNFGPYQHRQKVLPTFVRKALAGQSLPVYGDGQHVRCWLYVEDHCSAIWHLLHHGIVGEVYHVAGEKELKNIDLARIVLAVLGKSEDQITFIDDFNIRPGHDRRYALDIQKISKTGWKPEFELYERMDFTINWCKNNPY